MIGYLLAFGAACCYGTTNVVVRALTLDYTSPLVVSTISLLFGMMLVAPVAAKQAVAAIPVARQSPGFLVYAGLSGLAAATGVNCTYFALQQAEVVVVAANSIVQPAVHAAAGLAVPVGAGEREPLAGARHRHHRRGRRAGRAGQHAVTVARVARPGAHGIIVGTN